jgi:phosphomannomutase
LVRFGHDGWLGQLAHDVTFDSVELVARAAGVVMVRDYPDEARLVVAYDRRFLSDAFARVIARVLASIGINVWLIPMPVSTAVLSFAIQRVDAVGGIMVTGGSQPAGVNGVRLRGWDGGALPRWILNRVEDFVSHVSLIPRVGPTAEVIPFDPIEDYLSSVARRVPLKAIRQAGITIAIDSMWGTGSDLLPQLIDGDGSRSVEIRTAHNPLFPELSSPRPVGANLDRLSRIVRTGDAALGLAISADGCSLGVIDGRGVPVSPSMFNALLAWYLLMIERRSGALARSISSSNGIDRIAAAADVLIHEMPVGHTSACETLREQMPMLFGDDAGGIIMTEHLYERDAVLAGLFMIASVVRSGMELTEVMDEVRSVMGDREIQQSRIVLTGDQADVVRVRLSRQEWPVTIHDMRIREMYATDGVKFELESGAWLLIRYDELDGVLQVVAEADDADVALQLVQAGRQMVLM